MTETQAFVALNLLPGMGPVRVRRLLARFGSADAILTATARELRQVEGIGSETGDTIISWQDRVDPAKELEKVAAFGAKIVSQANPEYPESLRELHDAPILLYVWGDPTVLASSQLGVVGTRKPSHYAAECAKKLSYQLAYAGITVTSGLARGVDALAHQAAIAARGRTVAVLGSGLNNLYPPENRELAEKIAITGAVVSEYPMDTKPDPRQFPMRNRIISGLSFGLLVVEAGTKSGSLISASQATEQGRSVYAVPGRIDQPNALGSNRLIQQGAKLVMSAQDILDDLGLLFSETPKLTKFAPAISLSGSEKTVHEALGDEETSIDDLIAKCGLPTHEVSSTLLALEMRRLVKQLPGGRFVKIN